MIKGQKRKAPLVLTDETATALAEKRVITKKMPTLIKTAAHDREYLLGMFDILKMSVELDIIEGPAESNTNTYRYTPRQMWENTKKYFEATIRYGQPLTITGIAMFNDLDGADLRRKDIKALPKEFGFLIKCASFVEMYNEYAAHRKLNPAGPIFILKNFGWKDTFTVEGNATQGALSEAERAEAQKRVADFSEVKIIDKIKE